jgi:hypothetical protein
MSGTETIEANLDVLEAVLDRQITIDSLGALLSSVDRKPLKNIQLENVAIGIDSSVFLKLANHSKSEDIVDYLGSKHTGPLILPGQAIQEYWNNQYSAIPSIASKIREKFESLEKEADKLGPNFSGYAADMKDLLSRFGSEFGYVYDQATIRSTLSLLTLLKEKAALSYVPRMRFHDMALNRKRTKTPPGFKDEGDGDFFIWADFLYGLLRAKHDNLQFNHAVILTHDVKSDWSRDGIAHPILTAEMQELVGVPFDVWTIEQLHKAIAQNSSAPSEADIHVGQ